MIYPVSSDSVPLKLLSRFRGPLQIASTISKTPDKIYSWIYRYDSATKTKTPVTGCCILDINTNEIDIHVIEEDDDSVGIWKLAARPCKPTNDGRKVPQLLATNTDLTTW